MIDERTAIKLAKMTREIRFNERYGRHDQATEGMARLFYYVETIAHNEGWHKLANDKEAMCD